MYMDMGVDNFNDFLLNAIPNFEELFFTKYGSFKPGFMVRSD